MKKNTMRNINKKLMGIAILSVASGIATQSAYAQGIDVVFKIDESGSMGGEINAVKSNVVTIFNALPAGSSVGLVGYGSSRSLSDHPKNASGQHAHVHTAVTSDSTTFQNATNELEAGGGIERGYLAIVESATDNVFGGSLGFTGAPYCNILITDETANQGGATEAEAIAAMNAINGVFFGIADGSARNSLQGVADATGGQTFSLTAFNADPTPVIEAVIAACVEAVQPVVLDIKPTSCPNPFKMGRKGVTPVAILGSDIFDVASVDPASVRLQGCEPLRWSMEDVATPFDGEFGDPLEETACSTYGADGYLDLTLKFDSRCLGAATAGETGVQLWTITGETLDGTTFEADDVVRVMP